jgi:hypothetical protein
LKTNDRTWHPSPTATDMQDERIVLEHGTVITADHFLIPWSDWGRLRIESSETGRHRVESRSTTEQNLEVDDLIGPNTRRALAAKPS